jgi:hypothetical protein
MSKSTEWSKFASPMDESLLLSCVKHSCVQGPVVMDWVFCDGNVSLINTQYQYPYLNTRYIKIHLTALQCNCLGSALILSYGNVKPSSYHGVHEAASDLSKEYSFLMGEEQVHNQVLVHLSTVAFF